MAITFIDLPDEIILDILASTDWKTILRCSAVSRILYSLISDSALLQYLIELGSALLIDDCLTAHSIPEKLFRLRDRQSRWKTLNFAKRDTFELGAPNSVYELQHGYWIQCEPRQPEVPVYIQQLPSVAFETGTNQETLATPLRSFRHENHGIVMLDFSIDPAQNLWAYVSTSDVEPGEICLHFRAISDNLPHPLAAHSKLPLNIREEADASYIIQILGDLVGIYVRLSIEDSRIKVFNWKYGTQSIAMKVHGAESFTFLSETLFLVFADDANYGPALYVYPVSGLAAIPKACFLLPKLKDPAFMSSSMLRCEPSPLPELSATSPLVDARIGHPFVDQRFFRTSPEARVMYLSVVFHGSDGFRHFSFLISAKLLLDEFYKYQCQRKGDPVVLWEEWGLGTTRILPGRSPQVWVSLNWGSRLILDHQDGEIEVLDFNSYTVRRAMEDGETKTVTQTTSIKDDSVFLDDEIVTGLPYTVCTLSLEYHYEGAMIDEERIIVVKREEKKLEVFVM